MINSQSIYSISVCKWQMLVRYKKNSNWIEYQPQYHFMNCTIVQFIMGKVHYLSLIPVDSAGEINFTILRTSLKYYFQITFLPDTSGGLMSWIVPLRLVCNLPCLIYLMSSSISSIYFHSSLLGCFPGPYFDLTCKPVIRIKIG